MSLSVPFLRQVAGIYLEKEGDRLQEYCFVFPNRRSSLFFRKYLSLECTHPVFSPTLITVNDFFASLSHLKEADGITLLYELYLSYRRCAESFSDTFDDFLRYGDVVLRDFDDIDKYLADGTGIFRNLCDLRKLDDTEYEYLSQKQREAIKEFWSSVRIGKKNSEAFLGTWQWLSGVYEDFRRILTGKGIGYGGLLQRYVVENMEEIIGSIKYERVVFIGFNALSACEAALMDALRREGKADFYWDYPGTLLTNPENRASHFMKENLSRYPSRYSLSEEEISLPDVTVVGIPSGVGQAKVLPKVMKEISAGAPLGELSTCIVLPDSSLLHPVLNSIPESVETVNVTMGYPLRESSAACFMNLVAQLQMRATERSGESCFYHIPVEGILEHPFVKKASGRAAAELKKTMVEGKMIYVPLSALPDDGVLGKIFVPAGVESLPDYLLTVIDAVREYVSDLDKEYLYHYGVCIRKLSLLKLEVKTSTWFSILSSLVRTVSVPLSGEPLSGLQIMGPLETMALDFRNVIILSMNDGVFPSRSFRDSMIPYNLRRGFGLPTYEVQDAIAAYHFYRSIARSEKVYLLYDTRSSGVGGSELSRYILQMKYQHRLPISFRNAVYPMNPQNPGMEVEAVTKTGDIILKLKGLNYSASSLLTYLKCPLMFFYSYVCGFGNEDEVEDRVDASSFGDLFHKSMELLHNPYEGKTVDEASVAEMRNRCRNAVNEAFRTVLQVSEIVGRNLIVFEMIVRYADKVLEREKADAPFRYIASELSLAERMVTPAGHSLRIKGKVDRYDCRDGSYRIVDYKTGRKIYLDFSSVEELFARDGEIPSTAFQLLFYLMLMRICHQEGADTDVTLEVLHTTELFGNGRHSMCVPQEKYEDFRNGLLALLDEILNPEIQFSATADIGHCEWCPFKILCRR